jgi:hypothetical protein
MKKLLFALLLSSTATADSKLADHGMMRTEVKDAAFQTPESVLYDAASDSYLVANINGAPTDVDDNGFISRLDGSGKLKELKWIDGSKGDVKLDAPKGMAIVGGVLYVADISVVRKFDAKTGKPKGEIKIDGATFLNDVSPRKAGGVFVTDSGLTPKFESSGTDAVYAIGKDDKVTALAKAKELGNPNGVVEANGKVYVVTFGTGAFYELPAKGEPKQEKLPKGKLDGIVALPDGTFLVSSWEGKTVFRGKPGKWDDLQINVESPADIGYDTKRKLILVPHFQGNKVSILDTNVKVTK